MLACKSLTRSVPRIPQQEAHTGQQIESKSLRAKDFASLRTAFSVMGAEKRKKRSTTKHLRGIKQLEF